MISVTEKINEPRYPNFKGIMAAKKKPMTTLTLADLGIAPADAGLANSWSTVVDATPRPPKEAGEKIVDDGSAGTGSPSSSHPPGWSDPLRTGPLRSSERHPMSEVLVLVDIVDGHARPVNAEMLTLAARLGTPAAVVVGAPGTAAAHRDQLAGWGAEIVYAAESADAPGYLITPQVAALATLAGRTQPAAVLLALTVDGREIAGRLAVRLDASLLSRRRRHRRRRRGDPFGVRRCLHRACQGRHAASRSSPSGRTRCLIRRPPQVRGP